MGNELNNKDISKNKLNPLIQINELMEWYRYFKQ